MTPESHMKFEFHFRTVCGCVPAPGAELRGCHRTWPSKANMMTSSQEKLAKSCSRHVKLPDFSEYRQLALLPC